MFILCVASEGCAHAFACIGSDVDSQEETNDLKRIVLGSDKVTKRKHLGSSTCFYVGLRDRSGHIYPSFQLRLLGN
jgi:hypothetical protein